MYNPKMNSDVKTCVLERLTQGNVYGKLNLVKDVRSQLHVPLMDIAHTIDNMVRTFDICVVTAGHPNVENGGVPLYMLKGSSLNINNQYTIEL